MFIEKIQNLCHFLKIVHERDSEIEMKRLIFIPKPCFPLTSTPCLSFPWVHFLAPKGLGIAPEANRLNLFIYLTTPSKLNEERGVLFIEYTMIIPLWVNYTFVIASALPKKDWVTWIELSPQKIWSVKIHTVEKCKYKLSKK